MTGNQDSWNSLAGGEFAVLMGVALAAGVVGVVGFAVFNRFGKPAKKAAKGVPAPRRSAKVDLASAPRKAEREAADGATDKGPRNALELRRKIVVAIDHEQERMMQKKSLPSRTVSKKTKMNTPPVIRGQK